MDDEATGAPDEEAGQPEATLVREAAAAPEPGDPAIDDGAGPVVDRTERPSEGDEATVDDAGPVVASDRDPVIDEPGPATEPTEPAPDPDPALEAEQEDQADPDIAPDAESPAAEIIDLPWDDDLPVALGDDSEARHDDEVAGADAGGPDGGIDEDGGDLAGDDAFDPTDDYFAERRRSTARSVSSWRNRSASGAIATAIAMGLQQVFEPEKRRPAAVAEAPSDPYSDDDPVTVEYVPDDAEATTVRVKPWLLEKGDPT